MNHYLPNDQSIIGIKSYRYKILIQRGARSTAFNA